MLFDPCHSYHCHRFMQLPLIYNARNTYQNNIKHLGMMLTYSYVVN